MAQRGSLSTKIQAFLPYAPNQCLDQYGIYASVNWINISSGSGLLQQNHYLTQCLFIIYLSIKKKLQLSLNQHTFSLKKMHLNILSMKLRTFRVIPMYWCNVYIYIYIYIYSSLPASRSKSQQQLKYHVLPMTSVVSSSVYLRSRKVSTQDLILENNINDGYIQFAQI